MFGTKRSLAIVLTALAIGGPTAKAFDLQVSFTNDAPIGGTYLTPAWVGFHDGTFDTFSAGTLASSGVEAISEDGNTSVLSGLFAGSGIDTTVGAAPVAPGATVSATLSVEEDGSNSFFSFASMVLPSSDFFIGNDDPLTTSIAGLLDGTFSSISVSVISVFDSGTEVNDFDTSAGNPLFAGLPAGQAGPNTGADEGALIVLIADAAAAYAAFPNSGGADLSSLNFSDYDSLATFTISAAPVPVPAALPLLLSGICGLAFLRRRQG